METILLQAEVLELKANPDRAAVGAVVESKMEVGRGSVATVLVQKGTLKQGDIFVVGAEWGRVRMLFDDHGKPLKEAIPGQPVEVLGLTGTPDAGDILNVVETEAKAREVSEYRARKKREKSVGIFVYQPSRAKHLRISWRPRRLRTTRKSFLWLSRVMCMGPSRPSSVP